MLEKLLWKNMLLPMALKTQLVHYYSKFSTCPYVQESAVLSIPYIQNSSNKIITRFSNLLHRKWVNNGLMNNPMSFHIAGSKNIPMVFWLLQLGSSGIGKINKLLDWGLNPHIHYEDSGLTWNYSQGYISLEDTKNLLTTLFSKGTELFPEDLSINVYEKAVSLDESHQSIEYFNKYKKMAELLMQWIDKPLYQFILSHQKISAKQKGILEYLKLRENIGTYYTEKYTVGQRPNHNYERLISALHNVEKIITNGFVFYNQTFTYNTLRQIFSLEEFAENMKNMVVLKCYEKYATLKVVAKKTLASHLISKKKELVLFNLLSYGLDLNWKLQQKQSIVGLDMLSSLPLIKAVLRSDNFVLCNTDSSGNNILHSIGGMALKDNELREKLDERLGSLSQQDLNFILYQYNAHYETPLMKALHDVDETMIDYLLSWGVQPWETIEGVGSYFNSPLNYLECVLLNEENKVFQENLLNQLNCSNTPSQIQLENEIFWNHVKQKWNAQHNFLNLSENLNFKNTKRKLAKI
jgi:hypothetical protein